MQLMRQGIRDGESGDRPHGEISRECPESGGETKRRTGGEIVRDESESRRSNHPSAKI